MSEISDLIAAQAALLTEIGERFAALQVTETQFANWSAGTATGGPDGDGYYPFTDAAGVTRMLPCIDKIKTSVAYDMVLRFRSAPDPNEVIDYWFVATPFTIKANMPGSGGSVVTPPLAPYVVSFRTGGTVDDPTSGTLIGTITVSPTRVFTFATAGGVDFDVPVGLFKVVVQPALDNGISGFCATVKA